VSATAYRLLHGARVTGASRAEKASNALATEHLWLPPARCRALGVRRSQAAWDDAVQEGSIALLAAARRYDAERGVAFEHYARVWVDAAIKAHLCGLGPVKEPTRRVSARAARGERAHAVTTQFLEGVGDSSGALAVEISLAAATGSEDEAIAALDQSRREAWVRELVSELEPRLSDALMAFGRDIGTCEHADRVGRSRHTIRLRKNAGLEYLRDYADTAPIEENPR
jgi:RNA polymerase sigma factor (sigma-70 family)